MATTPSLIILNSAEVGTDLDVVNIALVIINILLNMTMNGIVLVVLRHQKELQEYMRVLYQILAVSNVACVSFPTCGASCGSRLEARRVVR